MKIARIGALLALVSTAVISAVPPAAAASETAPLPASVTLYALDPFLVGAGDLGKIDLSAFLAKNPNLADYAAASLSADGVSAAIALFQTGTNAPVTFTINSAATLQPYAANFLTTAPQAGTSTLTVSNLIQVGSNYYAAALVQGPLGGYSSNNAIAVTAAQGSASGKQNLSLAIPPLVAVHGLWGDKTSLSNVDAYIVSVPPWNAQTQLVKPICYSKYLAFDAKKDPLSNGNDPCEVTSKSAVQTEIDGLLAELDSEHMVGGRVDLVVHSMGGLVARNYASQSKYASLRNRMQGQFHAVVTLDTPEIGSLLAPFLISKRTAKRRAPIWTDEGLIWYEVCGNADVANCFNANGYPIYAPTLSVKTGAVYSLVPDGPSLTNPNLSGPNIANSTWRAVSATAPGNSALALGLNTLIGALYPNPDGKSTPTLNSILQNLPNDAIVTVDSQIKDATSDQYYTFASLSHTSLVSSILTWLTGDNINDNSVTDDPSAGVYKLAACWLANAGATSCKPQSMPVPMSATGNGAAPRMGKPVDRIEVRAPSSAELGKPFEVAVHLDVPGSVPSLSAWQKGELGHSALETITVSRVANGTVTARVTPKLPGPVMLGIRAVFADGGVSARAVKLFVAPPKTPPLAFRPDDLRALVLTLAGNDSAMPHPFAVYPAPVGHVDLNARFVAWRLIPQPGTPVIRVDSNGTIHALAPGEASALAQFGSATATLRVIVRATQQ